jgi:hypothetical protein
MPTSDQKVALAGAIDAIRNAQVALMQQVRKATSTLLAIKLSNEYDHLDSCLSELLHAQNAADDASFQAATTSIQSRSDSLKADEDTIKSIIKDITIAGTVIKYVGQALAFIAKL